MSITVNLTKSGASEMLDFFLSKKESLIADNQSVFDKLAEYDRMIQQLRAFTSSTDESPDKYPYKESLNKRISYVMKEVGKPMKVRDIVNCMAKYEGFDKENDKESWDALYKNVAPTVGAQANSKIYNKRTGEDGITVFELKK